MGKETEMTYTPLFWGLLCFFWVIAAIGCKQSTKAPPPPPAIIVTTWETENGPGAKLVYQNHHRPYLGNNDYGPSQVTFHNADQVKAYASQMQRALDELRQMEDRMRQLEGQDVQEPKSE